MQRAFLEQTSLYDPPVMPRRADRKAKIYSYYRNLPSSTSDHRGEGPDLIARNRERERERERKTESE